MTWLGLDDLLDAADELQAEPGSLSHKSASLFIKALNHLRGFPHPQTQTMVEALWEIVYHNLVFVSLVPRGEELQLILEALDCGFRQAALTVPEDWIEMFIDDPIFQLGATLYAGSQAVDFYNGLLEPADESADRGAAHEAELIKLSLYEYPGYELDEYQKTLLEWYPEGLNSPRAKKLMYPLAQVQAIEA